MADEQLFPNKYIKSIEFGVLSPKIIKQMAAAKIVTPELYDKEGYPVDGGLMDIRLGVIDPSLRCKTDGQKLKESLGHFGYIELARPIMHINFIGLINTILNCIDRENSKVLLPETKVQKYLEEIEIIRQEQGEAAKESKISEIISEMKKQTKSLHTKAKLQKITIEKPYTFMEGDKRITPIEIRSRLEKISDDELKLFGINPQAFRPEWAVITIMAIPPVTMRPSITLESGVRSEDDFTHKLGDIVRINQRLFENINAGAPEIIIEDLWDLLQYHVTTYFDNEIPQIPPARHRSGQPLKTLSERIKSKEGRIRHNLAGKRTNFSARTVISPDPMLDLNEVGVPKEIATKITIPERVTEWNINYIKKFVQNGPKKYPGSNYIVRPDGKKKKITDETHEQLLEELQPGYLVERHLIDGDIAIFNRQPSLHRMSMMCHKIRVLPFRTFRMNPAVCHPYNADFDGDEMNLHIPQTEEARAEAEILMLVETQLVSPKFGLTVIGCIQDAVSGLYTLTKEMKDIPRETAVQMLAEIGAKDFERLPNKALINGKEIFSAVIPLDFSFVGESKFGGEPVIIENGVLKEGVIDSANVGQGAGFLLRNIHKKYGKSKTCEILGLFFRLGIESLRRYGLSTPISDIDLPKDVLEKIEQMKRTAEVKVEELIENFRKDELDAFPGKSLEETLELKILEVLNKARNEIGDLVTKTFQKETGMTTMIRSGAKGGKINIAQMSACVGQQAMSGKRIQFGYAGRTLSCFKKDDLAPKARGFIRGGFRNGMSPSEFFFAAMTGRDSLMDTALRTPKSGYLYRRLANAMQDLKVEYDYTVRDSSNRIVQFMYGDDGIDVSKSENGTINVKRIQKDVQGEKI